MAHPVDTSIEAVLNMKWALGTVLILVKLLAGLATYHMTESMLWMVVGAFAGAGCILLLVVAFLLVTFSQRQTD